MSDQFFGLTVEAILARIGVGMIVIDQNAIVRWVNPALCDLLGTTAHQIVDAPVTRFLTSSSRVAFEAAFAKRARGERALYELTGLRPDGTTVHLRLLPSPISDEVGHFVGGFAVVTDRAEVDALTELLSISDRIVENSGAILYRARLTPDFPIEYVSRNIEKLGYRPRDLVEGRIRFVDFVLKEDYPRLVAELNQHMARGNAPMSLRYRIRAASGQVHWFDDQVSVRMSDAGEAPYLEGILTDVTTLVHAGRERHRAVVQTVQALANTIEKRDAYTAGHQRQVANLSREIGRRVGLDSVKLEGLYLGALVHDVGKVAIPIEILTKPVALSEAEFMIVRSHAVVGQDILKDITLPWPIAAMVGQHHERLDGSGYPRGLKGDEIIQEARIIAVADVVEAMSMHRPYRPALSLEAALTELNGLKGSQFDPATVDACLGIAQEHSNDGAQLWPALERDTVAARLTLNGGTRAIDESRD
ncbi:MAG: HD domain-containing phosphohydrolase [Alphaproteobacteria bacterium]